MLLLILHNENKGCNAEAGCCAVSFQHQVWCAQPHVLKDKECRDAYVCECPRGLPGGTLYPVYRYP